MDTILNELKQALRSVWARPGFTLIVLIPLALGIGSNTAIFSAVYSVLLRSLPYEEPSSLVRVWEARPRLGADAAEFAAFTLDHFREWRESNEVFDGMAVYQNASFNLTGGAEPRRLQGQTVSPKLFEILGVPALHGRVFAEEEEIPGRERVVILSYGLWQRSFGAATSLLGDSLQLDGRSYTVVGVMPPEFRFPNPDVDFWVPMAMAPPAPARPGEVRIELVPVIARLKPGVTPEQAEAAGEVFLNALRQTSDMQQRMNEGVEIRLTSMQEQLVRPIRPALRVLFIAVGAVLLIACANVANLLLVRSQGREKEIALRGALGATRTKLALKQLLESLVYGILGGLLGLLLAYWGVRLLVFLKPADLPLLETVRIDGGVLLFNLVVALATAVFIGLVPAFRASKVDLVSALKGIGGSGAGGAGLMQKNPRRLRGLFAVVEIAMALVLLVGAGLMMRSFLTLVSQDPGYRPADALTMQVNLPLSKYPDLRAQQAFLDRVRESVRSIEGVRSSGVVNLLPLDSGRFMVGLAIEGRPPVTDRMNAPRANLRIASPGYFPAMGIRLTRGRGFDESDLSDAPQVVVVNEALVRRYFPDEDPMGERFRGMGEIVGVVADVRHDGLDADAQPEVYIDYRQLPDRGPMLQQMNLVLRREPERTGLLPAVQARVARIDPELPLANVQYMDARLRDSVARPRLYAVLFGLFATLALVLAVSGVYSVIGYSVSQRTRETGIRMALGASSGDIRTLVLREGAWLAGLGLALGLAVSVFASRLLVSVLFQIAPLDLWTFAAVSTLLLLAVLLASSLPARQAARTDPIRALRYE